MVGWHDLQPSWELQGRQQVARQRRAYRLADGTNYRCASHPCGSDNHDHRNANDNGDRGAFDVNDGVASPVRLPRPP